MKQSKCLSIVSQVAVCPDTIDNVASDKVGNLASLRGTSRVHVVTAQTDVAKPTSWVSILPVPVDLYRWEATPHLREVLSNRRIRGLFIAKSIGHRYDRRSRTSGSQRQISGRTQVLLKSVGLTAAPRPMASVVWAHNQPVDESLRIAADIDSLKKFGYQHTDYPQLRSDDHAELFGRAHKFVGESRRRVDGLDMDVVTSHGLESRPGLGLPRRCARTYGR